MILNFVFIPYYPAWSLVIIALNVFVIWALCVSSPGMQRGRDGFSPPEEA